MKNWIQKQWSDVKGNLKYDLIKSALSRSAKVLQQISEPEVW